MNIRMAVVCGAIMWAVLLSGCTVTASALYHGKSDVSRTDESPGFRWRK